MSVFNICRNSHGIKKSRWKRVAYGSKVAEMQKYHCYSAGGLASVPPGELDLVGNLWGKKKYCASYNPNFPLEHGVIQAYTSVLAQSRRKRKREPELSCNFFAGVAWCPAVWPPGSKPAWHQRSRTADSFGGIKVKRALTREAPFAEVEMKRRSKKIIWPIKKRHCAEPTADKAHVETFTPSLSDAGFEPGGQTGRHHATQRRSCQIISSRFFFYGLRQHAV